MSSRIRVGRIALLLSFLAVHLSPAAAEPRSKPLAPVTVRLETRSLGGRLWEVTLHAVPSVDTDTLLLELGGTTRDFGPTVAHQERTLTARITLRASGEDVVGIARLRGGGRAATARLGTAATARKAPTTVTLPGGGRVAEVRP